MVLVLDVAPTRSCVHSKLKPWQSQHTWTFYCLKSWNVWLRLQPWWPGWPSPLFRPQVPLSGRQRRQEKPLNMNHYANKKSAAESMLDVALLMANASQLKAVIEQGPAFSFYVPLIILISVSLLLQVSVGVLLIFIGTGFSFNTFITRGVSSGLLLGVFRETCSSLVILRWGNSLSLTSGLMRGFFFRHQVENDDIASLSVVPPSCWVILREAVGFSPPIWFLVSTGTNLVPENSFRN